MATGKQIVKLVLAGVVMALLVPAMAFAGGQSSSPDYQVNEVFFGSGGALNNCSSNFCAKESAGETAVGNASSANYQAQGGFNTDRYPYIQIDVSNTTIDLGVLKPTISKTATATFSVKAYLAQGYEVVNASDPPTNGAYTMQAPSTPTPSNLGTEQFGINLRANTSPSHFGTDPIYVPDATFSFGQVAANYDTPNVFMYAKGDEIAYSNASSSFTTFTISYLFNISNVTPGGTYTMNHVLVATGTY